MLRNFQFWLKPEYFKIVAFYPYTTVVQHRVLEQSHNYKVEEHDFVEEFAQVIRKRAEKLGCIWDNKVAVEIQIIPEANDRKTSNLFVGFYDGRISIGLSVYQPDYKELCKKALNEIN